MRKPGARQAFHCAAAFSFSFRTAMKELSQPRPPLTQSRTQSLSERKQKTRCESNHWLTSGTISGALIVHFVPSKRSFKRFGGFASCSNENGVKPLSPCREIAANSFTLQHNAKEIVPKHIRALQLFISCEIYCRWRILCCVVPHFAPDFGATVFQRVLKSLRFEQL